MYYGGINKQSEIINRGRNIDYMRVNPADN